MRLLPLSGQDDRTVDALLDAAFGADRRARTAYAIRRGMAWLTDMSFAAMDEDDGIVGVLQSWPVALIEEGGTRTAMIMVGPVAVRPDRQGEGVGGALMDALAARADARRGTALVMIGDPEYYGRWGFRAATTAGWRLPGPVDPRRLLARTDARLPSDGELGPR